LMEALGVAEYQAGKVLVVVNRYVNDQRDLLSETENMLGLRMEGLIPNDYGTASEAIEQGKPLTIMASRTTIGQWYLKGTDQLIGEKNAVNGTPSGKEQGKTASFFGRYLPSLGLETKRKPSVV
jgi:hypothetical protein